MNKDVDWELKDVVGLHEIERVGVKRKLRGLQEKCPAKRRKATPSVAEMFTLAIKLPGSVDAQTSIAEHATCINLEYKLGINLKPFTDEQDGSRKALLDARMKETREDHVRELDAFCKSFETRESKLLQEHHE